MKTIEAFISWAKRRGFIYPSAEIYSGISGVYDFGPNGSQLKKNLRDYWWKTFIESRNDVVGLDSAILTKKEVLSASGHLKSFTDPLIECRKCHFRFRADDDKYSGKCLKCGENDLTEPTSFNLMFKTQLDEYLRPETAQGMFVNFKNILDTCRRKIPFGIGQIGKSFRNELVSSGNFIFRLREFEIAEIEYFVKPDDDEKYFDEWKNAWQDFIVSCGISENNLQFYEHPKNDLAHYSKRTVDWQYNFPFGYAELAGLANRTDFDLKSHMEKSSQDLRYFDQNNNEKYIPYCIEPTIGIERL
ncbi:MAG: glycyl-tRNA synthetase, partial [Candidatus Berkelbacteria bacterium Licking1014_85]